MVTAEIITDVVACIDRLTMEMVDTNTTLADIALRITHNGENTALIADRLETIKDLLRMIENHVNYYP